MSNEWEKSQKNINGENDLDMTEGSYVDYAHTEERRSRSQASEWGRRMYGRLGDDSSREESRNQENSSCYGQEKEPKEEKKRKFAKTAAGVVAAGILFGCVAGGTMAGVDYMAERLRSSKQPDAYSDTKAAAGTEAGIQEEASGQEAFTVVPTSTGNDVSAIVEKAMPSVVAINNKMLYTTQDWFFGTQQYEVPSAGSGIIVGESDTELLIATNSHVIQKAEEMNVVFIDGSSAPAALKGTDTEADLAVIAVQLKDIPKESRSQIKVATLGDSDSLKLGNGVVAIGNALGEGQSVTVGYVSALDKEVDIEGVTKNLIQVDAAINPGNSGGALLDMNGNVIGINEAKLASTEIEGVGYAIPISYAKDIIDDLMTKTTKVAVDENEQGYLGIQIQEINSQMAKAYGMPEGIYVYKIVEGQAASNSDLRERDIITAVNGESVKSAEELKKMLTYYKGGEAVILTVQSLDNGSYAERQVQVTLDYRKDSIDENQKKDPAK